MKTLTVLGRVLAKEGQSEFVKAELLKLINPALKDKGVLQYDLHQHIDEPRRFTFIENWESKELLEAHLATEAIAQYVENTKGKLDEFEVEHLNFIGTNKRFLD